MSKFDYKELGEDEGFDPKTVYPEASFTQDSFYGNWQKSLGRRVRRFIVSCDGEVVAYFQTVTYPLIFGKTYVYTPYGPVVKKKSKELLLSLKSKLNEIAHEEKAAFVRLDFSPALEEKIKAFSPAPVYTYASAYFQPRREWKVPLLESEDEQMALMHKKNRYSVRQSQKASVDVEIVTENFLKHFDDFYSLMRGTAERNRFSLHPENYYRAVFESLSSANAYLAIASHEGSTLVIELVIIYGNTAMHVFGGSSSEKRETMPAYAAQWAALRHAQKLGLKYYNFGGISTEEMPQASWEGLTRFKTRFGGEVVKHSDFYDLVTKPFWYKLYNFRKRAKNR